MGSANIREAEDFQGKLLDFGQNFSSIEAVSAEFIAVKDTISQSVARGGLECLLRGEDIPNRLCTRDGFPTVQTKIILLGTVLSGRYRL